MKLLWRNIGSSNNKGRGAHSASAMPVSTPNEKAMPNGSHAQRVSAVSGAASGLNGKMAPKNKNISMPVLIVIFVLGIVLFSYPFISSFLYEQSALQVKTDYEESSNKYSQQQLEKMRAAVKEYNDALINAGVILMEPFDPETYDVDAMYVKLPTDDPIMGYVSVPSLNVTLPIYHTTEARALELGAGHLAHTSLPIGGANTHSVISAHSGLPNAEMFTHLDRLQNGNIFTIDILGETLTYEVYDIETVLPDEVDSLVIQQNQDLVTLVTCTPVGINTHRLLVHGKRIYPAGDVEEPALGFNFSYTDIVSVLALLIAIAFIVVLVRQKLQQKKGSERNGGASYSNSNAGGGSGHAGFNNSDRYYGSNNGMRGKR